jgi:hypothetical protein
MLICTVNSLNALPYAKKTGEGVYSIALQLGVIVILALVGRPPVLHPLKAFPTFYETQRFIATLTRTLH